VIITIISRPDFKPSLDLGLRLGLVHSVVLVGCLDVYTQLLCNLQRPLSFPQELPGRHDDICAGLVALVILDFNRLTLLASKLALLDQRSCDFSLGNLTNRGDLQILALSTHSLANSLRKVVLYVRVVAGNALGGVVATTGYVQNVDA